MSRSIGNGTLVPRPSKVTAAHRAFPLDALPPALREFVAAVADTTSTDPAFAALAAIVVISGCIGNRAAAKVKTGWTEPAVLWGALVGRSGTVKSPVIRLVTRPLVESMLQERRIFEQELEDFNKKVRKEIARWRRRRSRSFNVGSCHPQLDFEAPVESRLMVSDTTLASLLDLLQGNPAGLIIVRDELAAWFASLHRYASSRVGDQAAWLSFYDAAALAIDRKMQSRTGIVVRAAVSLLGSIQPGILARAFGRAERDSGLLARMLLVFPPTQPALWSEKSLSEDIATQWRDMLLAILGMPLLPGETGDLRPRLIPIDDAAKPAWIDWHDTHAHETANTDDEDLAAHYSKLKGACIRIALLFTVVDVASGCSPCSSIGLDAMQRAIAVVDFFKEEAKRIYSMLRSADEGDRSDDLVAWIEGMGGSVTARDLTHGLNQYRTKTARARADLDALVSAGLGKWSHPAPGPKGGRPGRRFVLFEYNTTTETPSDDGKNEGSGDGVADTAQKDQLIEDAHKPQE